MPGTESRPSSELLHASADTVVATIAGGLVLLVFCPLTLCAAGIKSLVRKVRPYPVGKRAVDQH
jgi:hypothetical protein